MTFVRQKYLVFIPLCGLVLFTSISRAQNPVSLSMTVSPAKAKAGDKLTARISASIGAGWHMYSVSQGAGGPIPTRITVAEGPFKPAGSASGSTPKREMDPNFGIMTEFYGGSASFSMPVTVDGAALPGPQTLTINVRYQVCNDKTCLPPKTVKVTATVEIMVATKITQPSPSPDKTVAQANTNSNQNVANKNSNINTNPATNANGETAVLTSPTPPVEMEAGVQQENKEPATSSDTNKSSLGKDGLLAFLWLAMATGALSLLTPCVFPMIPITVSYFTNHASGNRLIAVRDASIYALGIILTFTAIGVALALAFGAAGINNFAASAYVNLIIAGIFIAFALSLFGAYEIGLPSAVMTKLDSYARGQESTKIVGVLLMGFVFSLTSFTCTAPFVGTLLVVAAQGEWVYPVIGMLGFSTVFALPFFVLALAPQLVSQLPRSGGWLNSVKVVMGFLEVAAAMKFISNVDLVRHWGIFTREVVLASWVGIALLITLYLLGLFQLSHDSKTDRLGAVRLMCALLFVSLGFYLLTGLFGAKLGELESFLPIPTEKTLTTTTVIGSKNTDAEWLKNDYEAALAKAKSENKAVFIDFTGYTCTNCRWMEANMFPKPEVDVEMNKFVKVQLFTDGEGEVYEKQQKFQEEKFNTVALPLYAIVDADGSTRATFPGLTRDKEEFVKFLKSGD